MSKCKENKPYLQYVNVKDGLSLFNNWDKHKAFAICLHIKKLRLSNTPWCNGRQKLNFNEHVSNLCVKTSRKLQAWARIFPNIPQTQKQLLMSAYWMSQFSYCPLVWIIHSKLLNNCINGIKSALSLVYNDFYQVFQSSWRGKNM